MSKPGNTRPSLETLTEKKNLVGAEIGVYEGDNARWILDTLDIKTLYLIDKWDNINQYYNMVYQSGSDPRIKIYKKYSNEAVKEFSDLSLDFVYIDANHEYEYVKEDIKLWTPKCKKGGLIAGHDFHLSPGVRQAVVEEYSSFNQEEEDWWVTKI